MTLYLKGAKLLERNRTFSFYSHPPLLSHYQSSSTFGRQLLSTGSSALRKVLKEPEQHPSWGQ
jgi:hypothetical protein